MRYPATFTALVIAAFVCDARMDAQASWCANYQTGGTNCGFSNFAQCQAALSGNGGLCNQILDGAPTRNAATRERPTRSRAIAADQAPAYPPVAISIGIGVGGGSSRGHHGGRPGGPKSPCGPVLTNCSNTQPPGFR